MTGISRPGWATSLPPPGDADWDHDVNGTSNENDRTAILEIAFTGSSFDSRCTHRACSPAEAVARMLVDPRG